MNNLHHLGDEDPAATGQQSSRPNVFQALMSSSQERRLPKTIAGDQQRGDQKLHNTVMDMLEKNGRVSYRILSWGRGGGGTGW